MVLEEYVLHRELELRARGCLQHPRCVGELVVARLHKVPTILLKLPSFSQPDEGFLLAYDSLVPDLGDFSRWLRNEGSQGHLAMAGIC